MQTLKIFEKTKNKEVQKLQKSVHGGYMHKTMTEVGKMKKQITRCCLEITKCLEQIDEIGKYQTRG